MSDMIVLIQQLLKLLLLKNGRYLEHQHIGSPQDPLSCSIFPPSNGLFIMRSFVFYPIEFLSVGGSEIHIHLQRIKQENLPQVNNLLSSNWPSRISVISACMVLFLIVTFSSHSAYAQRFFFIRNWFIRN